jgi:hypothetical protein
VNYSPRTVTPGVTPAVMRVPMPSPSGTNFAHLYLPPAWHSPAGAYDSVSGIEDDTVNALMKLISGLRKQLSPDEWEAFEALVENNHELGENPTGSARTAPILPMTHGGDPSFGMRPDKPNDNPDEIRRPAMDRSFAKSFPDTVRLGMDGYGGVQPAPRRAAPMSARAAASYDAMFPDAARMGRI